MSPSSVVVWSLSLRWSWSFLAPFVLVLLVVVVVFVPLCRCLPPPPSSSCVAAVVLVIPRPSSSSTFWLAVCVPLWRGLHPLLGFRRLLVALPSSPFCEASPSCNIIIFWSSSWLVVLRLFVLVLLVGGLRPAVAWPSSFLRFRRLLVALPSLSFYEVSSSHSADMWSSPRFAPRHMSR